MKRFKMLLSVVLSLVLCLSMIPVGMLASAETTMHTIWQADPYLAGKNVGDTISKNLTYNNAGFPVTVGKDDDGYYYSITHTGGGWTYVDTGVGTATTSWIKNKNVLNAIAPYVTYSVDYRLTADVALPSTIDFSFRGCAAWSNSTGTIGSVKVSTVTNDWKNYTGKMVGGFTDEWSGSLAITPWSSAYPTGGYTMEFRNFKLQVSSDNATAINDALTAAGITDVTYDTLTSYDEFIFDPSLDDPNSYTIYDADPGLAGRGESEIISKDLTYNNAGFPVTVGKDKNGYYYSFTHTGGGWTYIDTGASAAKTSWIKNKNVLNAIAPYVTYSVDYRLTADTALPSTIDFSFRGCVGWNNSTGTIGSVKVSAVTNDWKNYTGTMKGGFTDEWSGSLAITPWASTYPADGYTMEFRHFKLQIKGKDKVAINKALTAANITDVTFDTLTSYEPYIYVDPDTPIWYADPDRSVADRNGDVDVTAEINDNNTIPALGYSTFVFTDEEEGTTFYRTIMDCQSGGSHSFNTYFTSGIAGEDESFGWMADANVIAALKPYMYIGYEYRFQSAGNIPSKPVMFMQAANWGSLTTVTTQNITPGSWQVVEPKKIKDDAFASSTFGSYDAKNWDDGEFMISIYGNGESFSGTQIIDIRNLRVNIPSQYREKINEVLSKVAGIDEIANFTLDVDLGTDENGNKDYFSLLSVTEKAVEYDLNDDDQFDVRDLIRMKKYVAYIINYMPEYIIVRADKNNDGELDSIDLGEMRKAIIAK